MKSIFRTGDVKVFVKTVEKSDLAIFNDELLHPVYSTFALARDFEWSSRLFFIDMKDDDEEGCGTFLHIDHKGPAFVGEKVTIRAVIETINGPDLTCAIEARVGERLVAIGKTGQKMLKKEKLNRIFKA